MTYLLYATITAGILAGFSVACVAYRLFRPEARKEVATYLIALSAMAATSYTFSIFFASPDASDRVQGVMYTVRALPYDFALVVLSFLVARSVGNKYPRLIPILIRSPLVFGTCAVSAFLFALVFPVPALQEFGSQPPTFLLLKARNVPELVYPALVGYVYLKELIRSDPPAWTLRVQNGSGLLGSAALVGLVATAIWVNFLKLRPEIPDPEKIDQITFCLSVENWCLLAACIGFFLTLAFYHSEQERDRLIGNFLEWIRFRHELELAFDQNFGDHLLLGRGLGSPTVTECFHRTSRLLSDPRHNPHGFTVQDEEKAEKLFLLLALVRVSEHRYQMIMRLSERHRELVRSSDLASRIFVYMDPTVRYDIRQDTLYSAIPPVLAISNGAPEGRGDLQSEPQWVQLAVLMARDAGFISDSARGTIYDNPRSSVSSTVLAAYQAA